MDTTIRSLIFKHYNRVRVSTRLGPIDPRRLNRALGILLRGDLPVKIRQYGTTVKTCQCGDSRNRNWICKHRLAFIVDHEVYEDMKRIWLGVLEDPLSARR